MPGESGGSEYSLNRMPTIRSLAWLALLPACSGRADAPVRAEFTEVHMGMPVRIVLYAPHDTIARAAARAAFARVASLEDKMSDFRAHSEVRRLGALAGDCMNVSVDLYAVLERAIELARLSGGAFDPTAGPVIELWRDARRDDRTPPATALDSARALVGWRMLRLGGDGAEACLARPGMRLDLGGIAKGYILEEALGVLADRGIASALVEAGGDIVVGAAPPGASGWRIAVPDADPALVAGARELAHAAIATSGPTEQFVEIDGVRHSHVVDPRTGLALTRNVTATVIASDGATADALATTLTVLSREEGKRLLEHFPGALAGVRRP